MSIEEIKELFEKEFLTIKDLFEVIQVSVPDTLISNEPCIYNPGVYVFWKNGEVWKVGRNLTNSRKRAWEHVQDNTHNGTYQMKELKADQEAKLLLFNVKDINNFHWVSALEIFLEKNLNPKIPSGRIG